MLTCFLSTLAKLETMRWTKFILSFLLTAALLAVLIVPLPPATFSMGAFFNPFQGFWQNAVAEDQQPPSRLELPGISAPAEVVIDERDVPHIFADNLTDAVYVQGYLTARDRLWQMDFQIRAASGRLTEVIGFGADSVVLRLDRTARRKGMPWAAERAIEFLEKDKEVFAVLQAYADGVNAWIDQMDKADYPLEFKVLNYEPEPWTPYNSALFLKYMANMLAAGADDIEDTYALALFGRTYFDILFPEYPYKTNPIVPENTSWHPDSVVSSPAVPEDYFPRDMVAVDDVYDQPPPGLGSNNWAVSGQKSANGRPMLANDPHLSLNLPSIWYEIQIHTPESNTYGVSLPGAPGIIIGFNDSVAWGVTNGSQDVMDFYTVEYRDSRKEEYRFGDSWSKLDMQVDTYLVKGAEPFYDTVRYTEFGPIMYDETFGGAEKPLAVRWTAYEASNEVRTFLELMQADNYEEYERAIETFVCPGQNFVFASAGGDIAIWQQGKYPLRWQEQGRFLLDAANPEHRWQGFVPQKDIPHTVNPEQGWVGSANQHPTSEAYPYYYTGNFAPSRARRMHELLSSMDTVTVDDMIAIQQDALSVYARDILPVMLAELDTTVFEEYMWSAYRSLKSWNYRYDRIEVAATLFHFWFDELRASIWEDEFDVEYPLDWPDWATTISILRDSAEFRFYQKQGNNQHHDRARLINESFDHLVVQLSKDFPDQLDWNWGERKTTTVRHLTRVLTPFNRGALITDGIGHVLNATQQTYGPSWRMIVELGEEPRAIGVYPGGQIGNPGHPRYSAFIDTWAAGEYFPLWRMTSPGEDAAAIRSRIIVRSKL